MTAAVVFPYPGDDPASLGSAADQLDLLGVRIDRLTDEMALSRAALYDAWVTEARDLADQDVGRLAEGLPTVRSVVVTARDALVAHQTALAGIRVEVDALQAEYRIQQRLGVEAESAFLAYAGRMDGVAEAGRHAAVREGQAALEMQEALAEDYRSLVGKANTSAQTCAEALNLAWDPGSRSRGAIPAAPGATLMALGGISAESLNLTRITADAADAAGLAEALVALEGLDPTGPETQRLVSRLSQIWSANAGTGLFATEFYGRLGAAQSVALFGRVAAVLQPGVMLSPDTTGPLTPSLIAALQRSLGTGLAAATADLLINADGDLTDAAAGGLGVPWVHDLMAAGRAEFVVPGATPVEVRGYVPLMATVATGSGFSAAMLAAIGGDLRAVELAAEQPGRSGEWAWRPSHDHFVRWNWSSDGAGFPSGADPFASWAGALAGSPDQGVQVLADDADLLHYLLNERAWAIRESGAGWQGQEGWLYGGSGEAEMREGLQYFGDVTAAVIGDVSGGSDHRAALESITTALTDRERNWRIDSGLFATTDYIPAELRPAIGSLLLANMPDVHATMMDDPGPGGPTNLLLAEAAKSAATDVHGHTLADRVVHAAAEEVDRRLPLTGFSHADFHAFARIAAAVAHGHRAELTDIQLDADAAHNERVQLDEWWARLIVDTATGATGVAEAPLQAVAEPLIDAASGDMQDTSVPTINDNADWVQSTSEWIDVRVQNQAYAAIFDELPAPPAGVELHLGGSPLSWVELNEETRQWVIQALPPGTNPVEVASDAVELFGDRRTELDVLRIPLYQGADR